MNKDKRYKYYIHKRKDGSKEVIAVSSYAGKKVKAKAVCSPHDEFDEEIGKKLSRLRCALKIEKKRLNRAKQQRSFLFNLDSDVQYMILKNQRYLGDTEQEIKFNEEALKLLLEELK